MHSTSVYHVPLTSIPLHLSFYRTHQQTTTSASSRTTRTGWTAGRKYVRCSWWTDLSVQSIHRPTLDGNEPTTTTTSLPVPLTPPTPPIPSTPTNSSSPAPRPPPPSSSTPGCPSTAWAIATAARYVSPALVSLAQEIQSLIIVIITSTHYHHHRPTPPKSCHHTHKHTPTQTQARSSSRQPEQTPIRVPADAILLQEVTVVTAPVFISALAGAGAFCWLGYAILYVSYHSGMFCGG